MHHQMPVSVFNRVDDASEQFYALADIQLAFIAPAVDRLAFNNLHHQVWPTLFGGARIEKFGDVRMIQRCKYSYFLVKSRDDVVRAGSRQQLNGNPAVEGFIGPFGEIHHAHAPSADLAGQSISADVAALQLRNRRRSKRSGSFPNRALHPGRDVFVSTE